MAKSRKSKKSSNSISINLSEVESSGRVADGDHLAEVVSIEKKESTAGNDYLNWKLKVKGGTVYHNTSLQPQALWNLRGTLEACGFEVPDDEFDLDLDALIGAELGITTESEVYQGKKKPVVVEVFLASEVEEGEEEETEESEEAEEEDEVEEEEEVVEKKSKKKKSEKKKSGSKIKKGSKVEWEDDDETYEGKVTDITDDLVTVVDEDGDEWELDMDEVKLA